MVTVLLRGEDEREDAEEEPSGDWLVDIRVKERVSEGARSKKKRQPLAAAFRSFVCSISFSSGRSRIVFVSAEILDGNCTVTSPLPLLRVAPEERIATSERHWSVRLPWKNALELQLQLEVDADAAGVVVVLDRLRAPVEFTAVVVVAAAAGRREEQAPAGAMAGTRIASIFIQAPEGGKGGIRKCS